MIRKLHNWFKDLFSKIYSYKCMDEVPDNLKQDVIYLIRHEDYYWQAIMICPCGCKKLLHMNLICEYKPYWDFKIEKRGRISFSPSIHRTVGCKSHFFVRKGKIVWA